MIKYVPKMTSVVLEEIPDRVSLAIDISNCRGNCKGCHSPFLKLDIGEELTAAVVDSLIADNFGIDCFLFLGEGRDPAALLALAAHIRREHPSLALALYSGREQVEAEIWDAFDYVKVGPYRPECGPLNSPGTNQRLYHVHRADGTPCPPGNSVRTAPPSFTPAPPICDGPLPLPVSGGGHVPGGHGVPAFAEDITFRFWRKAK